ncbi:Aromatic-ring hydroxylase-like protein [Metarhizium album ARSEF 1941]|uniref:Aromatic-ring hydroxylase-like protein n=1 Tax=Metarhizium album (strain ARSEF 1941) TaxID=1081103 RepID=A0A0B2WLM6_METAS|nr:Aromatic-ring hydroxylase-like protein [Metarhizium album ARSEF 1941]KHN94382.1 Aromatic-ring hydroxylase-like protein [Metarhizium album ARSEF 1941]
MPLDIAIIGAGIAGLTAAVSLSRVGHRVQIYEASAFSGEIGAALTLTPNGIKVLQHLGFDFKRARTVQIVDWDIVSGIDLTRISRQDLSAAADTFGAPLLAVHRVDLHKELMRLASVAEVRGPETGQEIEGIVIHLASPVTRVDGQQGRIEFADGTVKHAHLIVGADGLRSAVRDAVTGGPDVAEPINLISTGHGAFRFLITTEELHATAYGRKLLKWKTAGACLLADTKLVDKERHIMWYSCRDGTVQNFVGIHPSLDTSELDAAADVQAQMLQQFGHFDSDIVQLLRDVKGTKCWPLFSMTPLSSWTFGKAVLIGDAAHPMLPFGGQGANQAIEDGGVLGSVLAGVEYAAELPKRLDLFNSLRVRRASRVQILSSVRANKEYLVQDQIRHYMEPGMPRKYNAIPVT